MKMKIELFKIKKSFKKESFSVNPNTYFRFVVLIAFAVILVGFGFGFYAFKELGGESVEKKDKSGGITELTKKEKIDKVLEYFTERDRKSIEIINSPAPIVDPSL